MKSVLILDQVCYKPYTLDTLRNEPLGGTEASVLRLAKQLALTHSVHVLNGQPEALDGEIKYVTSTTTFPRPSAVIHLRTAQSVPAMAAAFPGAQQIVWHHDLGGNHTKGEVPIMQANPVDLVFVSQYHKGQFFDRGVAPYCRGYEHRGTAHVAYNIVEAGQVPSTVVNYNKLLFPSSPHKGLTQTLELFKAVRARYPQMELHVANPGYYDTPAIKQDGVKVLGPLTHGELLLEMRTSLAVFAANHVWPETFGLVYAEANAVGTPCIAHGLGAVPELLDARQMVDTRSPAKVLERLEMFINARPEVGANPLFRPDSVGAVWLKLIK